MITDLGKFPFAGPAGVHEISKVHTDLWGGVWAPETLPELMLVLGEAASRREAVTGWRGQSDIEWRLDSGAVRRIHSADAPPADVLGSGDGADDTERLSLPGNLADIEEAKGEVVSAQLEADVRQYESWLLDDARLIGHGYFSGRELPDIELLAILQHYGAATRLIDLSRNVLVALYFACADHPDRYGAVVGFHADLPHTISSEDDLRKPLTDLLDQSPRQPITWEPRRLFERMRVQQSFFLFSEVVWSKWGTVALSGPGGAEDESSSDTAEFTVIAVPPELKEEGFRLQRHALFGYDGRSLFPDLEGFARFHSYDRDFEAR